MNYTFKGNFGTLELVVDDNGIDRYYLQTL